MPTPSPVLSPPIPWIIVLGTAICFSCWRRSFSPEWSRACRLTIREAGWENKGEELIFLRRGSNGGAIPPDRRLYVPPMNERKQLSVSSCCKRTFDKSPIIYIILNMSGFNWRRNHFKIFSESIFLHFRLKFLFILSRVKQKWKM